MKDILSLVKSESISLTNVSGIRFGLLRGVAWNKGAKISGVSGLDEVLLNSGLSVDLSLLILNKDGFIEDASSFINFENAKSTCESVVCSSFANKGQYSETIDIDFVKIPKEIDRMIVSIDLYQSEVHGLSFGMISNVSVVVEEHDSEKEVCSIKPPKDSDMAKAIILGELFRTEMGWAFKPLDQSFEGGLPDVIGKYRQ